MVTVLNVALENHPGSLADILEILARAEINVDAVEAEAQGDFGTARLLVGKPKLAGDLLRQDGYDVVEAEALDLRLPNRSGELAKVSRTLATGKVNVLSLFGTLAPGAAEGRLLLRVSNVDEAKRLLKLPKT